MDVYQTKETADLCRQILYDHGFLEEFSLDPNNYINKPLYVKAYKLLRVELYDHWDNGGSLKYIPHPTSKEKWIAEQAELENERKRVEEEGPNTASFVSKVETNYSSKDSIESDEDDGLIFNIDNIHLN